MKLILWLAIGAFVIWQLRGMRKVKNNDSNHRDDARGEAKSDIVEPMIRCAHCKVYVPSSEVIFSISGAAFCCEEHRKVHV